jgi:hypothetical protein
MGYADHTPWMPTCINNIRKLGHWQNAFRQNQNIDDSMCVIFLKISIYSSINVMSHHHADRRHQIIQILHISAYNRVMIGRLHTILLEGVVFMRVWSDK